MEKEKLTIDSVKNFEAEVDYTTVLDNFEGPLDLLLYLIKQEEIEIKDIFVSQVTEQFLAYMKGLPSLDLEKASEYLDIAATILDIKARRLVPPPDYDENEEYDSDDFGYGDYNPEREWIQALEEYQTAKRVHIQSARQRICGDADPVCRYDVGRAGEGVYQDDGAFGNEKTGKSAPSRNSERHLYCS